MTQALCVPLNISSRYACVNITRDCTNLACEQPATATLDSAKNNTTLNKWYIFGNTNGDWTVAAMALERLKRHRGGMAHETPLSAVFSTQPPGPRLVAVGRALTKIDVLPASHSQMVQVSRKSEASSMPLKIECAKQPGDTAGQHAASPACRRST